VSYDHIVKALAAYIRTLKTQDSPFDQHLRGHSTLSAQAERGFNRFVESGCASCHFYVNMAGPIPGLVFEVGEGFYELFPNHLGSKYDAKYGLADDIGRYQVTGDDTDKHMWRVASLRNVALTGPYFHNGSVQTLDEAIRVMGKVQLKKDLADDIVADIAAFLNTLSGEFPQQTMPRLPE
jgi:cytochrome c peroxidase